MAERPPQCGTEVGAGGEVDGAEGEPAGPRPASGVGSPPGSRRSGSGFGEEPRGFGRSEMLRYLAKNLKNREDMRTSQASCWERLM